jgi:Undecaprenyl-phosphate glucose phosphotransferase
LLKQRRRFLKSILLLTDIAAISVGWVSAYWLRFYTDLIPVTKGIPVFSAYLTLFPVILIAWGIAFQSLDLYHPRRTTWPLSDLWDITKGSAFMVILLVAISFFLGQFKYSRLVFVVFGVHCVILLVLNRWIFRRAMFLLQRKGYNQDYALIIGAGELGRTLFLTLRHHSDLGIEVVGYLTRRPEMVGQKLEGVPVLGLYQDLPRLFERYSLDQIFIAVPQEAYADLAPMIAFLQEQTVDVRMVPDIIQFMAIRGQAELFEGIPVITLQATPLHGWNRLVKRVMDILCSLIILAVAAPLLLMIAGAIKVTSPGPIFYRQRRMGFDGQVFEMLKFRTMHVMEGDPTTTAWTVQNDPRRTSFGVFLRAVSLDELPQFFNVLKGEMSIVGPRPERPEFVEQFKQNVPKYMLRHKIKAGITGWAQIHGLRGDTSIDERIKYDLEYIERWSPFLDLQIMVSTLWKGFINKNAY